MVSEIDNDPGIDSFVPSLHKNTPSNRENEARSALSGEKVRDSTSLVCPVSVERIDPFVPSQIRISLR
jgi:hypothetical protein